MNIKELDMWMSPNIQNKEEILVGNFCPGMSDFKSLVSVCQCVIIEKFHSGSAHFGLEHMPLSKTIAQ